MEEYIGELTGSKGQKVVEYPSAILHAENIVPQFLADISKIGKIMQ